MYSNISSNDDDLFSGSQNEPKKEKRSGILSEDLENLLKDNSDTKSDSTVLKARLAIALYDTAGSFVSSSDSSDRTLFNTLNALTDNRFAYDLYADQLEESISKRLVIYDFTTSLQSDKSKKLLEQISRFLKTQIDSFFFTTYMTSFVELLDHTISYNTAVYVAVCNHINRPPLDYIINRNVDEVDNKLIESIEYVNNSFASIRDSLGFSI